MNRPLTTQEVGFAVGCELRQIFGTSKTLDNLLAIKQGSEPAYLTGLMMGWSASETNRLAPALLGTWH